MWGQRVQGQCVRGQCVRGQCVRGQCVRGQCGPEQHTSRSQTVQSPGTPLRVVGCAWVCAWLLAGCGGQSNATAVHADDPAHVPDGGATGLDATDDDGDVPPSAGSSSVPGSPAASGSMAGPGVGPAPGSSAGPEPSPVDSPYPPIPLDWDATPNNYRYVRLTHAQWANSVRDNLRMTQPPEEIDAFDDELPGGLYDTHEDGLYVSEGVYFDYETAAESLAARLEADPQWLSQVYAGDDPEGFVAQLGRRFYRRPLTDAERATYLEIFETGAGFGSSESEAYAKGASFVLGAMLQAPSFVYRSETSAEGQPLDAFELATKLAYFLTNTTPTDALLESAANGGLDSADGVEAEATQLLDAPGALEAFRRFHGQTWHTRHLAALPTEPFPEYTPELALDLQSAADAFFDHVYGQGLGLDAILTDTTGFVTPRMGAFYDVDVPGEGLSSIDLGPERPGYFTQLPFLMMTGRGPNPNTVRRGIELNDYVLCAGVPIPDGLDIPGLPEIDEGMTNRERLTAFTAGDGCRHCHEGYINPLGFALENFDGFGVVRATDNGFPVDTSGAYPFSEGAQSFDGAPQLMRLLAESEQAHRCYAAHLLEYALGRQPSANDSALVDTLARQSQLDGSTRALALQLVTSDTFRIRRGGTP